MSFVYTARIGSGLAHHQCCILPTNSQQVKLPTKCQQACLSSCAKQGQISCTNLGTQLSPTSHPQKPQHITAHIHSSTLPLLHSHVPAAIHKLHSRTENSLTLTSLLRLISCSLMKSGQRVGGVSGVGGVQRSAQTMVWHDQPIRTKALSCRAHFFARANYDTESR